ncbi:MAG: hypothetical protein AB7T10_04325 [bacterium]
MKKIFLISSLILGFLSVFAQYYSGEMGFNYLNIPISPSSQAFSTAGAAAISGSGDLINPASLFYCNSDKVSVNYMNYIAGSHFGLLTYAFDKSQVYLKYFNSGFMERRDSLNTDLGEYSANVIIANYSKSFLLSEKIIVGAGISAGMQNITDYKDVAGSVDLGIIYRNIYSDFLSAGISILNLGAVYDFEETSMTPAKFVAGVAIAKDDMPFAVYIDAGKILDKKYFYAAGMEFFLIRHRKPDVENVSIVNTIPPDSEVSVLPADSAPDTTVYSAENIETDTAALASLNPSDSIPADTSLVLNSEIISDTNEAYQSYADYLDAEAADDSTKIPLDESLDKKKNSAETIKEEEPLSIAVRKKSLMDPFAFSFKWGFSSDREELMMGYGSDLLAGFTAGFRMSYNSISVNYSAKMWGQLGITQTLGIGFSF